MDSAKPEALRRLREDMFSPDANGVPLALCGTRCLSCGRVFFPARAICSQCGTDGQLTKHVLDSHGIIHASTVVRVQSALGHTPPYAYGYVDLPKEGLRIFAPFSGAPVEAFAPGLKVRLAIGEVPATSLKGVLGYSFVPYQEAAHG